MNGPAERQMGATMEEGREEAEREKARAVAQWGKKGLLGESAALFFFAKGGKGERVCVSERVCGECLQARERARCACG
jgi:hypothetical protein